MILQRIQLSLTTQVNSGSFQQLAVANSFMVSVLTVLVHWLKMDAQKTYVLWLNRNTEEQAFSGRGARARQVATHLSAEVRAVLANTDLPTPITVSYGGQHLVQGATHRSSLCRVERIHGTHQNFERIACKRFFALSRQL